MTLRPVLGFTTVTVLVPVTGITMPVMPDDKLRMY